MDSMTNGTSLSCVSAMTAIRKSADTSANRGGYPDRTNFSSRLPSRPLHPRDKETGEKQIGNQRTSQKSPSGRVTCDPCRQGLHPTKPAFLVNRNRPPRSRVRHCIEQQGRPQRTPQPNLPRGMLGQTDSQGPNQKISQRCRSRPLRHWSQAVMKIQKNIREKKCKKRSRPAPRA